MINITTEMGPYKPGLNFYKVLGKPLNSIVIAHMIWNDTEKTIRRIRIGTSLDFFRLHKKLFIFSKSSTR